MSTRENQHPWLGAYPPGLDWQMDAINEPAQRIFEASAEANPQHPCLDFLGRHYTYGEVHALIRRFAAGLQAQGLKKGSRIGLCLPNSPYYVIAYFAVLKIGATVVNFNPLYTGKEIEQQVLNSEISTMVTLDLRELYDKVQPCLQSTQLKLIIHCPLGAVLPPLKGLLFSLLRFRQIASVRNDAAHLAFSQLLEHGAEPEAVDIDPMHDIALFQYTGGTTGVPKAAMLTHSNIVSNAEQVTRWLKSSKHITEQERFLAVLPFFHVFSMTAVMNMGFRCGAELILLPRFQVKQTLQAIAARKPTILAGVPAIFNAINQFPQRKRYDLSSLAYGISGGAALPAEVKRQFEANSGCVLVEGYGLSETSPVITCNPPHNGGKEGSIGLPLPGTEVQIRSTEDDSIISKPGEMGELLARGPQVMPGYWKRDEENAKTLLDGGWLRTGDVGYMDEEGYVFLTDRLKDVIITNGYKVYPRTLEDTFYKHEAVAEVIAIGIPDDEKGEVPKVFVTLKDGARATEQELLDFVRDKLNPIERPAALEIRRELPKTLIGKPSKKALVEEETRKREAKS